MCIIHNSSTNIDDFLPNIGKRCYKTSGKHKTSGKTSSSPNPFKSGFKINTIKGVINHPILNIPAYTFIEDESYVECRRVIISNTISDETTS